MIQTGRAIFLFAYALYWGGLTFYTGFVVRISHDVLNDPMDGGLITQRVTELLQILGALTVAMMFANALAIAQVAKKYAITLLSLALILAVALVGLYWVHGQLDAIIDIAQSEVTDRDAFVINHRRYNQLTTVQWIAAVAYLPITVFAWRHLDSSGNA